MNSMKKLLLLLLAITVVAMSGCGKADDKKPVEEPKQTESGTEQKDAEKKDEASTEKVEIKDTLTYGLPGDAVNNVNVFTTNDRTGLMTLKLIYSPLYTYTQNGINYFLAESMEPSEDGTKCVAKLRQGVKWTDGQDFNADDVVFTFGKKTNLQDERWLDSMLLFGDKAVQVNKLDDYTVEFVLPEAVANPYELFAGIFIAPEHIYKDVDDLENNDFNKTPVGTGPYKLVEHAAGQYLLFEANENYMFGAPSIPKVVYKVMENSSTAMLALQKGEVDILGISSDDIEEVKKNENLEVTTFSGGNVQYLKLNQWSPKFSEEKVREAVFYSLNKDEILKAAFKDSKYYNFTESFLPNGSEWINKDLMKFEPDSDKAKKLLEEAGVKDLSLKLGYNVQNEKQGVMALVIQQQLEQSGIKVELVALDPPAMYKASFFEKTELFDMFLGGYTMGIDPDTYFVFFDSGEQAYFHLENEKISELFNRAKVEMNLEKRKELYNMAQVEIQNTKTFYPFGGSLGIIAHNKNLTGFDDAKLVSVFTFDDMSKIAYK